jgi:hypothetical protein
MAGESSSFFLLLARWHVIMKVSSQAVTRERHTNNGDAGQELDTCGSVACTARKTAVRGCKNAVVDMATCLSGAVIFEQFRRLVTCLYLTSLHSFTFILT